MSGEATRLRRKSARLCVTCSHNYQAHRPPYKRALTQCRRCRLCAEFVDPAVVVGGEQHG